jgi:hypothetical protein
VSALAEALNVPESELILSHGEALSSGSNDALEQEVMRSKASIAKLAGTSPDKVRISVEW